jgi:putative multiple sugar transport system substrate-binding protein
MQGRKKWMAMILAVGLTGSLAACGTGSGADKAPLVGVAMPTKEQDRWVADGNNLRKEFTSLGFQVEMQYATGDPAAQAKQIQTMIDDHVDALVIGAVDGTALKAVLAEAHTAHIPIIAYDRLIRDSGDVDYYASFNNWQVGVMEGTALLQGMGVVDAGGKPTGKTGMNIEVFAGSPDDNNATFFYDGAMSVVRPFIDSGAITVPSGQVERADVAIQGWKGEVAGQRMTTLLAPYQAGLHLDGVLAPNDGLAQAIIGVVKPALGYVPVVPGQDAEIPAVKSIAAGEQVATVYKDTRTLAEVTVGMVRELLKGVAPEVNDVTSYDNGVKVVPSYLLTPQLVTKDNYKHVLVDGGYYTEAEIG